MRPSSLLALGSALVLFVTACGSSSKARRVLPVCDGVDCDAGSDGQSIRTDGAPASGGVTSSGGTPGRGGTSGSGGSAGASRDGGLDADADASSGGAGTDASVDGGTVDAAADGATTDVAVDGAFAGCIIGGTRVAPGATETGNPCHICDPSASASSYTNLADGVACSACNSCSAGVCAATVLSSSGAGSFVSLHGSNVYWADSLSLVGSVWSVPTAGGTTRGIVGGLSTPGSAVSDGSLVYFAEYGGKRFQSVPESGGTPTPLVSVDSATMVVLRSGVLYLAAIGEPGFGLPGGLFRLALQSDAGATTITTAGSPYELTTDATNVYWTDTYTKTINAAPLAGSPITPLVTLTETPQGIAVDATSIYFTTAQGGVYSAPLAGGTPTPLATGLSNPLNLALDGGYLYVADWGASAPAAIVRIPIAGNTQVPLLTTGRAYGLAVDAQCVYASTHLPSNAHHLVRLDK